MNELVQKFEQESAVISLTEVPIFYKKTYLLPLLVYIRDLSTCIYTICVPCSHRGQNKASDSLEL